MNRPVLIDLFCGAGGAAVGYHRAGFDVVGVDHKPQPRYPFTFYRADALQFLGQLVADLDFDAVHASPPCQVHTKATRCRPGLIDTHDDLVAATRAALQDTGVPWVIENVRNAPIRPDYRLCGCMFGLPQLRRERWFETSWNGRSPGRDDQLGGVMAHGHHPLLSAVAAAAWNLSHPGKQPRCHHGFSPEQGLGLWCPACEQEAAQR